MFRQTLLALACALATTTTLADDSVAALRAELAQQKSQLEAQQKQIDALANNADSKTNGDDSTTTVGFYGEVHFNHMNTAYMVGSDGERGIGNDNIHLHRAVIFLGHQFTENLRFFSEVEFEGAPDSNDIEVEVEQAFIDWKLNDTVALNIGQFLIPVGLLNETHEPDTFYGVERNPIEEFIIPETWWEKGVMARAHFNEGFAVDFAVHNGLNGQPTGIAGLGTADGLREFRQEFGGARADNLAYTLRTKYTGISGLELGATAQKQTNIVQSNDLIFGGSAPATLLEAHADWHWRAFGLRALAAQWEIDNALAKTAGTDKLKGFYIEPTWKLAEKVGVFYRYNQWNTVANVVDSKDTKQINFGANWWIASRVVLKADVQNTNLAKGVGDGFNLGMGLSF